MTAGEYVESRPRWPLQDLSDRPGDWLDLFVFNTGEDYDGHPDERFAARIMAIYQMREIERREGRDLTACPRSARVEKLRREGKPVPVERYQVYDADGALLEITRVSFKGGWFYSRPAGTEGSWGKRRPLPLPADWRLAGWTR